MGKGYAEGPAVEEAQRHLEELERGGDGNLRTYRKAVYGATKKEPERHFIGWLGDVDPDELFKTGKAWGLTVVRRPL